MKNILATCAVAAALLCTSSVNAQVKPVGPAVGPAFPAIGSTVTATGSGASLFQGTADTAAAAALAADKARIAAKLPKGSTITWGPTTTTVTTTGGGYPWIFTTVYNVKKTSVGTVKKAPVPPPVVKPPTSIMSIPRWNQ